jgi:hypothetical protein
MVKGLAMTLDYFNFDIQNAIQTLGTEVILNNCYRDAKHTNCDKVHRKPSGLIDFIDDKVTNVGGNATSGLDFAVAYGTNTKVGALRGQVEGTYLFKYEETNAEGITRDGTGNYDLGIAPRLKSRLTLQWAKAGWGVGTNVRYVGGFKECQTSDCATHLPAEDGHYRDVEAYVTGDLFGSYDFKSSAGHTSIGAGINNVIDADPPGIYSGGAPDSDGSAYDFIGRYFYLRLTQGF